MPATCVFIVSTCSPLYGTVHLSHVINMLLIWSVTNNCYRLEETLGSGQFGEVYRALWHVSEKKIIEVAVKVLKKDATNDERIKFLQEAAIMGQFCNASVLKLHGIVSNHGNVSNKYKFQLTLNDVLNVAYVSSGNYGKWRP